MAGYGIKSALVPAHTWLPDAHGRAPSSISALLSGILIETNLYVLVKVGLGIGWPARQLGWLLIFGSFMNMFLGNGLALVQSYGKRLLGYSSIAQVGYMMLALGVGLVYANAEAISAALFLMVGHAVMKGLAFLCKGICHFYCDATLTDELRGMRCRLPLTTGAFVIALGGLAGVPPLAGFTGKWRILIATLGEPDGLIWIAVAIFALNGLISLGYYLRLVGLLLAEGDADWERIHVSPWMLAPMVVLALLVVFIGVCPQPVSKWTGEAARALLIWGQ